MAVLDDGEFTNTCLHQCTGGACWPVTTYMILDPLLHVMGITQCRRMKSAYNWKHRTCMLQNTGISVALVQY